MDSILASRPAALSSILGVPNFFQKELALPRFINSALLREWTVQSLIVDRTQLVLVSGKLVLQKDYDGKTTPCRFLRSYSSAPNEFLPHWCHWTQLTQSKVIGKNERSFIDFFFGVLWRSRLVQVQLLLYFFVARQFRNRNVFCSPLFKRKFDFFHFNFFGKTFDPSHQRGTKT